MEEGGGSVVEDGGLDIPLRSKPILRRWRENRGCTFIAWVTQRLPSLRWPKKCSIHFAMLTTVLSIKKKNEYEDDYFLEKVLEWCI